MNPYDLFEKMADREWRLANIYRIMTKDNNRVIFRENRIQRLVRTNPAKRKRVLKARQFGISTGGIIDMLDRTLFTPNTTSVILAHEKDGIQKLFRIVHRALQYPPAFARPFFPRIDRGGGSKYEVYFPEINSRIYCDLESRGDTIHNLHISEAAFVEYPDRLKATIEAVPLKTGRITIETTPNGIGNHFYDDWMDPHTHYAHLFFPWFMHDEYRIEDATVGELTEEERNFKATVKANFNLDIDNAQIAFRRFKQQELKELMPQEYPEDDATCFLSTGNAVMDLVNVRKLLLASPDTQPRDDGIKIYRGYVRGHIYGIGADPAEGVNGDFSAACCIDFTTNEQVATFRGQKKPSDFADILVTMGNLYSREGKMPPVIAVERNNHGHAVLLSLTEIHKYPNLFQTKDGKYGWLSDRASRPRAIDALIDAVDNQQYKWIDPDFLRECLTLINDQGKIQAATGKHDDTIMAAAIAVQMGGEARALDVYQDIGSKIRV